MPYLITLFVIVALVAQTQYPAFRLTIMSLAASAVMAFSLSPTSGISLDGVLNSIPWDVLIILGSLNSFAQMLSSTGALERASQRVLRLAGGSAYSILVLYAMLMFLLSALVNNLTAMFLIAPLVFETIRTLRVSREFGVLLVAALIPMCNLGGAATPIGDFPAILLLTEGRIEFGPYLLDAFPWCLLAAVAVPMALIAKHGRHLSKASLFRAESEVVFLLAERRYSQIPVQKGLLASLLTILALMFLGWSISTEVRPAAVAFSGTATAAVFYSLSIAIRKRRAKQRSPLMQEITRRKTLRDHDEPDTLSKIIDPVPLVFFFCVFVLVGSVQECGVLNTLSGWLQKIDLGNPLPELIIAMVAVSMISAAFSAGPGMALAAPLMTQYVEKYPAMDANTIWVATALGICAGSGLFLFAATAGPILQREVEKIDLSVGDTAQDDPGWKLRLDNSIYKSTGIISWLVILFVGIAYLAFSLRDFPSAS